MTKSVSLIFSRVGVTAVIARFSIPSLMRRPSRRYVYSHGALSLILATTLLGTVTSTDQISRMLVRVFGTASRSDTPSFYIVPYLQLSD